MGVTEVTQPVRLYLDEMIPVVLAVVLGQYGYDVLTAKEANMFGKSDEDQLAFAVSNQRTIITFNIKDFILLHQKWLSEGKQHSGIIVSPEIRISKLIHLCLRLLGRIDSKDLINQLHFLQEFL
jgi:predicted nuclease of predicted toxin-antitoxin system